MSHGSVDAGKDIPLVGGQTPGTPIASEEFNGLTIGDVVRYKHGGPEMTVIGFGEEPGKVICRFTSKLANEFNSETAIAKALLKIS